MDNWTKHKKIANSTILLKVIYIRQKIFLLKKYYFRTKTTPISKKKNISIV